MCKDCEARRKMARDALMKAALLQAAGHVIKGTAEAFGIKEKTGSAELKDKESKDSKVEKVIEKNSGVSG